MSAIDGVIIVNKPSGISSNKVVNLVKSYVGADKAGHFGTLDPIGEGVLPVALGKATKYFDKFLNKDKIYKSTFKFGEETDTLDRTGIILHKKNLIITKDMINRVLPKFIGDYDQMPPVYSAKKIKGQNAYKLARQGIEIELKPKRISIYDLRLEKELADNCFEFLIHCSSGTYIRSLCRDMAYALSTYGSMYAIERTSCGVFGKEGFESYNLEQIKNNEYKIIDLDTLEKI